MVSKDEILNKLKFTMEASIDEVRKQKDGDNAIELFCLIGMMPNGITEKDLKAI